MRSFRGGILLLLLVVALLGLFPAVSPALPPPAPPPPPEPHARWISGHIPGVNTATLETALMDLRGLRFRRVVPADTVGRPALERLLVHDMDEEEKPEEEAAVMRAFGMIGPRFNFRKFKIDMLTEQIAGFYDPRTQQFNVVESSGLMAGLGNALGSLMGFDQPRVVTIHEMDHALDDQYFHIQSLEDNVRKMHNGDRMLALQALVEGEATWIMLADASALPLELQSAEDLKARMDLGMRLSGGVSVNGERAPLVFQRSLVFPYEYGLVFVHRLRTLGEGWDPVNAAWAHLPVSTQQILHPFDYLNGVQPIEVDFRQPLADHDDWKPVEEDTMGEYETGVFLEQHTGDAHEDVTLHWRGDRYRVYAGGGGDGAVWVTIWDTPGSAARFAYVLPADWQSTVKGNAVIATHALLKSLAEQPWVTR